MWAEAPSQAVLLQVSQLPLLLPLLLPLPLLMVLSRQRPGQACPSGASLQG
jgi:hypothetical protein